MRPVKHRLLRTSKVIRAFVFSVVNSSIAVPWFFLPFYLNQLLTLPVPRIPFLDLLNIHVEFLRLIDAQQTLHENKIDIIACNFTKTIHQSDQKSRGWCHDIRAQKDDCVWNDSQSFISKNCHTNIRITHKCAVTIFSLYL